MALKRFKSIALRTVVQSSFETLMHPHNSSRLYLLVPSLTNSVFHILSFTVSAVCTSNHNCLQIRGTLAFLHEGARRCFEVNPLNIEFLVYNSEVEAKSRSVEFDYKYSGSEVSVTLEIKMINMRFANPSWRSSPTLTDTPICENNSFFTKKTSYTAS